MSALPFDPEDPPDAAPRGCDRLTWQLARQLYRDHTLAIDGRCHARTCRDGYVADWPCQGRQLAETGLLASVGAWAGLDLSRLGTRWFANVPPPRGRERP
jgi:hypothetical protein